MSPEPIWSDVTADGFAHGPAVEITDDQGQQYSAQLLWTDDEGAQVALSIPDDEPMTAEVAGRLGAALLTFSRLPGPDA